MQYAVMRILTVCDALGRILTSEAANHVHPMAMLNIQRVNESILVCSMVCRHRHRRRCRHHWISDLVMWAIEEIGKSHRAI